MLRSVTITETLRDSTNVNINHILIQGCPQWIIGRNVVSKCGTPNSNRNYLEQPNRILMAATDFYFD